MANPNTPLFPNTLPGDAAFGVASDGSIAVLTAPLGATDTSMSVSQVFNVPCLLAVDNEVIYAQGVNGNMYTNLVRGFNNTSPSNHASGTSVYGYIFSYTINQLSAEVKAICSTLGANLANVQLCSVGVFNNQTSMTVTHNLNTEVLAVQFWDSGNNIITPSAVQIIDTNNILVTFAAAQSGSVYVFGARRTINASISGSGAQAGGSGTNLVYGGQAFINQTNISIPHNLNNKNLILRAYDTNNVAYETGNFTIVDNNNATLVFAQQQSGRVVVVGDTNSASKSFTSVTSVTFAHNLSQPHIMVNTFDQNGTQFQPDTVQIVDLNTVTVTFDVTQSGRICVLADPQYVYLIPTAGTSFTIKHNLNTQNVVFQCYDTSGLMFDADTFTVVDSNTVTITFINPQAGSVLLKA